MQGKRTAVYCRVDRGGNSEMRRDALEMQKRKLEHYAAERDSQFQDIMRMIQLYLD